MSLSLLFYTLIRQKRVMAKLTSPPLPQKYYLGGPGNPSDIYICPKMHEFNKFLDVIILHPKKYQINTFLDTSSCQTGSQALRELLLSVVDSWSTPDWLIKLKCVIYSRAITYVCAHMTRIFAIRQVLKLFKIIFLHCQTSKILFRRAWELVW